MLSLEVHNVSKIYKVYAKPVDRLKEIILRRPYHQAFQPLREVSFTLADGGTLGIIGDNGAGKSTLLKLLAGTLTPSHGEIIRHGRVAALLELGAGFHPEFSGRQNIHLNASLLGLSDAEIKAREAEIIEFSELGEFIDRPVKTYSSGMYVRLAFSIATSVDPDILIIDEALSVGDGHFQKKCINRMMQFKEQNKSMLFCTHNIYQVQELCDQALWLKQGRMEKYGAVTEVITAYAKHLEVGKLEKTESAAPLEQKNHKIILESIKALDQHGAPADYWECGQSLNLEVTTRCLEAFQGHLGIGIVKLDEELVFGTTSKNDGLDLIQFNGTQRFRLHIPNLPLNNGVYKVRVVIGDEYMLHPYHDVIGSQTYAVQSPRPEFGCMRMAYEWRIPMPKG
jgi:ABC-type polysaccharide/polyol phosphate transport system ATPase subunit